MLLVVAVVLVVVVAVVVVVVAVVVAVVVVAVVSGKDVVLLCVLGGTVDTLNELDSDSSCGSMVAAGVEGAIVDTFVISVGATVVGATCTVTGETGVVAKESLAEFGMGLVGSAVLLLGMFSIGCCDPGLEVSVTAVCESSAFSGG